MHRTSALILIVVIAGLAAWLEARLAGSAQPDAWVIWAIDMRPNTGSAIASEKASMADDISASQLAAEAEALRRQWLDHTLGCRLHILLLCKATNVEPIGDDVVERSRLRAAQMQRPQLGTGSARSARSDRDARRAANAPEVLGNSLPYLLVLAAAGIVAGAIRKWPAWPFLAAGATGMLAVLAHQALALASFDLRHVELVHLERTPAAFLAAMIAGAAAGGTCARSRFADVAVTHWLAMQGALSAFVRGFMLALLAAAWVLLPAWAGVRMLPAVRMEGLLLIAALGLATFTARNMAWTHVTGASTTFGWPVVALGVSAAAGASLMRGDAGALALTLGLAMCWLVLCASRRAALVTLMTGLLILLVWLFVLPPLEDTDAGLPAAVGRVLASLPGHVAERVEVAWTPFGAGSSDVARALWLADLAGWEGLGFDLPVEGLDARRIADRRLTQISADYLVVLLAAVYGIPVAWMVVVVQCALFVLLGRNALAAADLPGTGPAERLVDITAAFVLLGAGLRALTGSAGALGVLPLAGLPVPGLSLGMAAAIVTGCLAGWAMVSSSRRDALRRGGAA